LTGCNPWVIVEGMKASAPTAEPATFAETVATADSRKLAIAAGVSTQSVHKWKSGKNLPGLDIVPAIAKALGWPTATLQALVIRDQVARKKSHRKA